MGKGIITEYDGICAVCGRPAECRHHLIFGRGRRKLADQDRLTIPVCNDCHTMNPVQGRIHDNPVAERLSAMLGQMAWEKAYGTREEFRERYGESFL